MNAASDSERPEGEPVSLWVATAGTTDSPVLRGDAEVDVAVIGAGIAGLTALALKRAGHTVAVVETARVGTAGTALILTDTFSGRANGWAAAFNSNRITPVASARRFMKENIKTMAAVVTGKLSGRPSHAAPGLRSW